MTAEKIVGLVHRMEAGGDPIVGRSVVADGGVAALARYARRHRVVLFCEEQDRARVAGRLGERATVLHRRAMLAGPELGLTVLHEQQFDVAAPFGARAVSGLRVPVTLLHHTLSYEELLHDSVLRLLLARARPYDTLICTSHAARTALEQLLAMVAERFEQDHGARIAWGGRLTTIPLGVDTERCRPLEPAEREAARQHLSLEPDAFVALWLGRLSAIDKADLLPVVAAFGELVRRHPERKLRLVCVGTEHPGEGFATTVRDWAQHLGVAGSVRVTTDSAQPKEQLYAAADVFVSPVDNIQESFGLTPVEAMAAGVPQVVSDWNGYRETVDHGVTGFLLPTLWTRCQGEVSRLAPVTTSGVEHLALAQSVAVDMRAFVEALERLMLDPDLAKRMGQASRRRAEERFAWPVVVEALEALWDELAAEAAHDTTPLVDGHRYARPDFGRTFRHYPSRWLDDDVPLRLTPAGEAVMRKETPMPLHHGLRWGHLDPQLVERILLGFARTAARGETLDIARVVAVMSKTKDDPMAHDLLARHVAFLIKYGYVELARELMR